jgi:hypothetical protein
VSRIAAEIGRCSALLDVHSTSAATPPFALPVPHPDANAYAATFPVDFVVCSSCMPITALLLHLQWAATAAAFLSLPLSSPPPLSAPP